MQDLKGFKHQLGQFGRSWSLLMNRATMYQPDHPYFKDALESFFTVAEDLVQQMSPLVFILHQERFFIDEEPLDPRVHVDRLVDHFKKAGIQSVSFYRGLRKNELRLFMEVFISLHEYSDADAMIRALDRKGIEHLRINHVFYQKVTSDDEVVSREALTRMTPEMSSEAERRSKKIFLDALLETALAEEFEKTITVRNLVTNPSALSNAMIDNDLTGKHSVQPGSVLAHQLDLVSGEIEKTFSGKSDVPIQELAVAVFQMKAELIQGVESRKILGIAYENEQAILEKAHELTDRVFFQIVKDEYRSGGVSTERMARILRRLLPDPDELRRLLPGIKTALLEAGMSLPDYLQLIKDLGWELQDEGLSRVLQEAGEQVGVDGDDLIEEIKKDPQHAAGLMALAAEIRNAQGDDQALTDILVEYVESQGLDTGPDSINGQGEEERLRKTITGVKSTLFRQLRELDVQEDVLARIENKLTERLDAIEGSIKLDYMRSSGPAPGDREIEKPTVLQTLERSVGESDELGEILRAVRRSAEAGRVDEDDFARIYAEIERQKQIQTEQEANREMPPGVLNRANLRIFVDKEIKKALRYELPFSALAFTVIRATFKEKRPGRKIPAQALVDRVLHRLAVIVRDTDLVGTFKKNQMVAMLPLTPSAEAKPALRRIMKLLHNEPFDLEGVPLEVKLAGTALAFQKGRTPDTDSFLELLSADLVEMANRVRNIHALM